MSKQPARPLVSIVLLIGEERSRFLAEVLDSVESQTYRPLELVVVDRRPTGRDGGELKTLLNELSLDGTILLRHIGDDEQDAATLGIQACGGEFVGLLRSRDLYEPKRVERLLPFLGSGQHDLAFSKVRFVDLEGLPLAFDEARPLGYRRCLEETRLSPTVGFRLLERDLVVSASNLLFRRDLYERLLPIASVGNDWERDFVIGSLFYSEPAFVQEALYTCRVMDGNRQVRPGQNRANLGKMLESYLEMCETELPPNLLAPCARNWPRRFSDFLGKAGNDLLPEGSDPAEPGWMRTGPATRRLALVTHDAHPHGAQYLMLHMAKALKEDLGFELEIVVLGDGPLLADFAGYGALHQLSGVAHDGAEARDLACRLAEAGGRAAIVNTTVSGLFASLLKKSGFKVVCLIHELPGIISSYGLQDHVQAIARDADKIVFPARIVQDGFESFETVAAGQALIKPQGLFRRNSLRTRAEKDLARSELRRRFEIPPEARVVLSIGYVDLRKGIDLFVEIGRRVFNRVEDVYFLWVGHFDPQIELDIRQRVAASGWADRFIFPGLDFDSDTYYAGADVYALTSREDPFPSVVLEALDAELPVVAFDGAGGFCELLSRGGGLLVEAYDTGAFATALITLLADRRRSRQLGQAGAEIVSREFSFRRYLFDLLAMAEAGLPRVSVVIPNYNYEEYIARRLRSVTRQTLPVYEIIVLDDRSTDASVAKIREELEDCPIDWFVEVNSENSGSPVAQWKKGVELARGDLVWIAEADDLAQEDFLEKVVPPLADPAVVMSFCQSKQMGVDGEVLSPDYLDYVSDISVEKWRAPYVEDGEVEIRSCLAVKNTVPNASAVVFRREVLARVLSSSLDTIGKYRVATDWMTYVEVLKHGKIAFLPESLNLHRRHPESVTIGRFGRKLYDEIVSVQNYVAERFPVDARVLEKSRNYAGSLREQFGVEVVG